MHEPLEPRRLGRDRRRCLARLDRAVLHRLGVAADRGQRRLQLVADREQERALRLARLRELRREIVERRRERRELGGALDGHRLRDARRARGCGSPRRRAGPGARCGARAGRRRARRARRRRARRAAGCRRTASSARASRSSVAAGRTAGRSRCARRRRAGLPLIVTEPSAGLSCCELRASRSAAARRTCGRASRSAASRSTAPSWFNFESGDDRRVHVLARRDQVGLMRDVAQRRLVDRAPRQHEPDADREPDAEHDDRHDRLEEPRPEARHAA